MQNALLVFFLNLVWICNGYKILTIFPMPAPSHYILGEAMAKGLAEAGHDVTMVSPFKVKEKPKNGNYREIVLTGFMEKKEAGPVVNFFDMDSLNIFENSLMMNFIGNSVTENTLRHQHFQDLVNSNETFDVVIVEQFCNEALKPFAYHFNAHLILLSTIGANPWVNYLVGNPSPPSYIPEWRLDVPVDMNLLQRTQNFFNNIVIMLNLHFIFYPRQKKIFEEVYPDMAVDFYDQLYNVSLVLVNAHESVNQPVPMVPNMVNVGGYHINPPKKLPADLQEFMDNAKDGVVYFSLGSNIKPSSMNEAKKAAILASLGKLKQKVLWKWDEETLPSKPANIKLGKWFPQQDILAHPNMRLFITHGGLLSTTETIYHGVPVLALPIFADQKMNAARAREAGYGLTIPFSDITEENMNEALNKLLKDKKYHENAQRRSKIFHDRPLKPMAQANYWIEYVVRTNGATHLRVGGVKLPLYQYFLLDSVALIFAVIFSPFILYKITCGTKKSKKAKSD